MRGQCGCGKSRPKRYAVCPACWKKLPKGIKEQIKSAEYPHDTKDWKALRDDAEAALGRRNHATDASA
jgi:hypothetical protein